METAKKVLLFACGIILVVGFIALGFSLFNKGKTGVATATGNYDKVASKYDEVEYAIYDGSTASGAQVVEMIKNLPDRDDNVTIKVLTKANDGTTPTWLSFNYGNSTNRTASEALIGTATERRANNDDYINPTGTFDCVVKRDGNGIVLEVEFKQK
ncbi:MAG: hypothetical protein MJ124_09145 [Lachnospiraceae bacterium]|nr:hypothetical protein [Lachnospiraceae bacterium]